MHATQMASVGPDGAHMRPLTFFRRPLVPGFCPSKGLVFTSLAAMFGWGVMMVPTGCYVRWIHSESNRH